MFETSDRGTSLIEGDMLCDQWETKLFGSKNCMTIFRNPESKPEMKDEYLAVSNFGVHRLSPSE
jgi:hypothetical protein